MNDELKDPASPPAADAAPVPTAVPVAEAVVPVEAAPIAVAPIDAKPPEAMPVIFNTPGVTPNPPPAPGGPMAALRSIAVLVVMFGAGYFILTELGLMKPVGAGTGPSGTAAILAQVERDSHLADQEASAREAARLRPPPVPPPPYAAPTITVSAGMIGDRRNFPPDPPIPSGSSSAKPGGKKGTLDEGQTLDLARAALAKGESTKALAILDGHDRDFATGLMNPDAKVLRIEALARTGEDARAKELAENFLADFPHSPLAPRTRGLLDAINRKMAGGQ
ncbi:MAG: hypothetical protein ABIP39_01175 [Polyangiaceae bacterium]